MAEKKVITKLNLHMPAGKANPSPPVGPMLGQHGLNIGQVVKEFNDKTNDLLAKFGGIDVKVPVLINIYVDRSYSMEIFAPITSDLIKWKTKQKKGSGEPNKQKLATISRKDLEEIAEIKKSVMNTDNLDAIIKSIVATAKNMGIDVEA